MQSILQYRRFKGNVADQYERDKEKARAFNRHGHGETNGTEPSSPALSSTSSAATATVIPTSDPLPHRDLEKADGVDNNGPDDHEEIPRVLSSEGPEDMEREGGRTDMLRQVTTTSTQASRETRMGQALTGIVARDRTTREGGGKGKVFVVGYEGESDPLNPHNWSRVTRWCATFTVASIGFIVGFASSIDSAALPQASAEFGVSEVTESLATGLFLIGFGCGALLAGPISETVGRNPVYIVTMTLYMIFIMASGLAPNIGAQLAFRFLAGLFGSTPLTCAGGSVSDLWNPMERVYAFPVFANAAFMGPIFGPVIGGFIGQSSRVSWRWCEWVTLIISGAILVIVVLFQPETYAPILLKWKAAHLRELTGDDRYRAEIEIREETFLHRIRKALYRPFILTFQEPIIMLVALYLTVIYILLFTFLDGYTYIFTNTYGFSQGITGLAFLGIGIGLCFASLLVPVIYVWARRDLEKIKAEGGDRLPPEFRLWYGMFGAPAIPISIFWLGWTAYPSISYWCPLVATVVFGYGILCIFISCYQYIIDSYETFAASALASVTLIRYVAAGGMVEVAIPMYSNLGVHWTLTILGAISTLMVPVPYLFYFYGKKIRGKSKYTVSH
jgi:MFS family permease